MLLEDIASCNDTRECITVIYGDLYSSSTSKKRRLPEDGEFENVISRSFDNVSMTIDRAIEVMAKCFSKSYGAEV